MRRYRVSGLVNQVFHGNGVNDTQTVGTTNWLAKQEAARLG